MFGSPLPVRALAGAVQYLGILHTTAQSIAGTVMIPAGWATVNVSMVSAKLSAVSGDVVVRADVDVAVSGFVLGSATIGPLATRTASATVNAVRVDIVRSGVAVTQGALTAISISRLGLDVGDTLDSTIAVLGLIITPVTYV